MSLIRSCKLALLVLPVIALGCSNGEDAPTDPGNGGGDGAIVTDHTEPLEFLNAFVRAWNEKDFDALAALLHEDFEFKPIADDEFPWIPEGGWNRGIELGVAANMFNPNFISEDTGEGVDTIEIALNILNQRTIDVDGQSRLEITADMDATVLWAQGDGATSDVRAVFHLVLDENDYYRMILMREFDPVLAPGRSVEASTWGSVKNLYRS